MMRTLALVPLLIGVAFASPQGREPLRLKRGDTIAVTSEYGGEYKIMPDGAIYGRGFGRLILEGQTWSEAENTLKKSLRKFVKEDEVHVLLKDIRREVVYLVGMGGHGTTELQPDMRLRQMISGATIDENADQTQIQVFRDGKKVCDTLAADLLKGDNNASDIQMKADDVVTLTPVSFVRVWVTGLVNHTGQMKLPAGTDPYKAIAAAGGLKAGDVETDKSLQDEVHLVVRRGPETIEFPIRQDFSKPNFTLESGDTLTVIAPETRRITIGGEVGHPGEFVLRGDNSLNTAITLAGGATPIGTLTNVLVLRKGELYKVDASGPITNKPFTNFTIESGDLVYVQRNERTYMIMGEVAKPGKVRMRDGRGYRLADVIADADGLSSRGTMRRISVARADSTGKMVIKFYNLDEYFKDGKQESNPEILEGDCILVGEPKGITFGNAMQALSGAILFESISNRGRN